MPPRRQRSSKFQTAGWPHIPDLKGGEERATPPGAPVRTRNPGPYQPLLPDAAFADRVEHIVEHLTGPCPGCNDAIALIRELEPFYQRAPSNVSEPGLSSAPATESEPPDGESATSVERAEEHESTDVDERAVDNVSTRTTERAPESERTMVEERADDAESTAQKERLYS